MMNLKVDSSSVGKKLIIGQIKISKRAQYLIYGFAKEKKNLSIKAY